MFFLYFYGEHHERHHLGYYRDWADFSRWRCNESAWLLPGSDPDDPFYFW